MINKFLFATTTAAVLIGCQPTRHKTTSDNGMYQCINASITIGGKPTTVLVEWNTQTGVARFLDSAIFTSKTTGAQNAVLGWVPLGELNQVIQEVLHREQQQPTTLAPTTTLPSSSSNVAPTPTSVETQVVKPKKS